MKNGDKSENKLYLLARNQTRRRSHDSREFKERRFLSDERQPEENVLRSLAVIWNNFLGKSSL